MVCQAMIIAMTVVLPAPVASFRARRISSGLAPLLASARCSRNRLPVLPNCGATSVSQMAVSTASIWQKNGPNIAELVMPPMLEEALGIGRDFPIVGIREAPPLIHVVAEFIDDSRSRVVLLLLGGESLAFVEDQFCLGRLCLALPRLGDRRDELGAAAALDNPLGRLAVFIELPILSRVLIGRVENRPLEELIIHVRRVLLPNRVLRKLRSTLTFHKARCPTGLGKWHLSQMVRGRRIFLKQL